ncbi:radical SAM protein [Candidatus Pacearchaeota archaeon]|nr:radical SAM protein [Candidatus Pacearchaeota archaeon]
MINSEQLKNKELNEYEYSNKSIHLHSSPINITLCTTYKCNMKCIFCLGRGEDPDFSYDIYKNIFDKKLNLVLKKATDICFTGWGEFLLWPGIENFLDYLNKEFPHTNKILTTNGAALSDNLIYKMIESFYTIQISLHTSQPLIHRLLTQSNSFEQILRQLDKLVFLRNQRGSQSQLWVALIFLATSLNIENLPAFVDFAGSHGANHVICNYLTVFKPEQLGLSCFFLPSTTNQKFDEAQIIAQKYNIRLNLPPRFGVKNVIEERNICQDPWKAITIDALGNIHTCCFTSKPIGNLNTDDFESIWNSEEYKELRSYLIEGRLHERCKNCYKFSPVNINDIRSHITFRNSIEKNDIFEILALEKQLP